MLNVCPSSLQKEKVREGVCVAEPRLGQIGVFDISMADIRKTLIGKHSKISEAAQELLLRRYPLFQLPGGARGRPNIPPTTKDRANLTGLVLGCIEANFCKKICV